MKISAYLRDRIPLFLLLAIASVLSYVMLVGVGAAKDAAIFVVCVYTLLVMVWVAIDCVRKYTFYRDIPNWLETNNKENLPINRVERPGFAEGQALYDALEHVDGNRQEAIARHVQSSNEYREYIESWVHEIKTPLAAAKLHLANHPMQDGERLSGEVSKVEGYISQVLYYARASSLEKDFRVRALTLDQLVNDLLKKNSMQLIEAGFSVNKQNMESLVVMADASWLEFTLAQVVSNAIKYRSAQPRIEFIGESLPNAILLHVRDNGIGIPLNDLPHVFEKGYCGENGRMFGKSTGMGLYIADKLCQKMGLSIQAHSQHGCSTTITIRFPVGDEYNLTKL